MTALARIEVTEWDADVGQPRTTVVYFDPNVMPEVANRLQPIIAEALSRIPLSGDDARGLLAAEIARLQADSDGYRREAARRGVLRTTTTRCLEANEQLCDACRRLRDHPGSGRPGA